MEEIKTIRKNLNLTQAAFAEKFKFSQRQVQAWEQGVNKCPEHVLNFFKLLESVKPRGGVDFSEKGRPTDDPNSFELQQTNDWYASVNMDAFEAALVSVFGADDVVRNYKSKKMPLRVSFYVKSRDMYIDLHDFAQHGGHWYDPERESDEARCRFWSAMSDIDDRFVEALCLWTGSDPVKRWYAGHNKLNYVVFWDFDGYDMALWLGMGCPSGQDWLREYSWIPDELNQVAKQ